MDYSEQEEMTKATVVDPFMVKYSVCAPILYSIGEYSVCAPILYSMVEYSIYAPKLYSWEVGT